MKISNTFAAAAIAFLGTAIASPTPALAVQNEAMSGAWQLNREQSDDFQQKMQETMEAGRKSQGTGGTAGGGGDRRHRGGGRAGRGRGSAGGGGGADLTEFARAEAQEFRHIAADAIETFEFGAAGDMVAFRYPDGRSLMLKSDGKTARQRIGQNNDIQLDIKTKWDHEKLVVEREIRSAGKIKETYWINDAGQLIIDTEVAMGRGGMRVEVKRVYDRVEM